MSTLWDTEADCQRGMRDGVWGELQNEKQVMQIKAKEKLMVQKRKTELVEGLSEEIFCTELVWIRKEKGDNTLPAGEWRFS